MLTTSSVVLLSARARLAVLSDNGIHGAPPRTAWRCARLQCVKFTRHACDSPACLPLQFHRKPADRRLRSRQLLAPANVCRLPAGIPPLALCCLATPLWRVSVATATSAATTTIAAAARTPTTAVGHGAAQRRAGQLHGVYRVVAMHRDVQRCGPRVSRLSGLSLS